MVVAYDGGPYRGFAPNPGVRTVGGTLAAAIERVLRAPVALTCAGRTDAGVHAQGQVVSFDVVDEQLDLERLQGSINALCAPSIAVRSVERAAPDFDARRSATSRSYRYTVLNRAVPDPFLAATTWRIAAPVDLTAMNEAAEDLLGEHDFSSFCRRKTVIAHTGEEIEAPRVRRVASAEWRVEDDDLLCFEITANAFCQQMVRAIVGTLVETGTGKRRPDSIPAIIAARDRHAAGRLAPPHGLVLDRVGYAT